MSDDKPVIVKGSERGMTNGDFNGVVEIKQEIEDEVEAEPAPVILLQAVLPGRGEPSPALPPLDNDCQCSCEELLNDSFDFTREFSRILDIIKKGRPINAISVPCNSSSNNTRMFKDHYYEKVDWLAGCKYLRKLYCWPCLLFDRVPGTWNRQGFDDVYNFHKAFRRHENTQNHIVSSMQLIAFVMNHCQDRVRENAEEINASVRTNRETLRRLIEVVTAAGTASFGIIEPELLLRLARKENTLLCGIPNLHTSLLNASNYAFKENLKTCIEETPYVSLFLDETQEGNIVAVLRYTTSKGELQDTFIGFMEEEDLGSIISKIEIEFDLKNKLVAILLGALSRTETLPRDTKAILLHSPAHRMSSVIPRALQHLKECSAFYHIMHCFKNWLKNSHVEEEIKVRLPNTNMVKWCERPEMALYEHREVVQDLVHNMLDRPTTWDSVSYTSALALQHALKDIEFIFLLKVFQELLPVTEALLDMVTSNSPNIKVCCETVDDYIKVLNWKKEKFEEIWESVQDADIEGPAPKKPRHIGTSRLVAYYRSLYENIVDAVVRQIEMRFSAIKSLEYCELIDIKDSDRNLISEKQMIQLRSKRDDFDSTRLRNELLVAYVQVDFKGLQCEHLLRHLYTTSLSGPLKQVTRLARLILVHPYASRTSYESCIRLFSNIHAFSNKLSKDASLLPWSIVAIENKLINKMVSTEDFTTNATKFFSDAHTNVDLVPFQPKTL